MKDLAIRQARQSDARAITAILQDVGWFAHLHTENSEQAIRQVEHHILLCNADQSHSIYVAEGIAEGITEGTVESVAKGVAGNVAERVAERIAEKANHNVFGYVAVHWLPYLFLSSPEGYISELFVHRDYYNQGIGQALLQAVISEASDRGCSRLMLVNSKQRESYQRQFYVKQGWREREYIANFIYPL